LNSVSEFEVASAIAVSSIVAIRAVASVAVESPQAITAHPPSAVPLAAGFPQPR